MTINKLITHKHIVVLFQELESWHHILHFFLNGIPPQISPHSVIKFQWFFGLLWKKCSKLMSAFPIIRLYLCNHAVMSFWRTSLAHQIDTSSSNILFTLAYSATSTGLNSFKSFNSFQLLNLSFTFASSCQSL